MLLQSIISWAHEDGSMHCISILAQPSQQGPTPPLEVEDATELLELALLLPTLTATALLLLATTLLALPPPLPPAPVACVMGGEEQAPAIAIGAEAAPMTHANPSHLIGASSEMGYYSRCPCSRQHFWLVTTIG
jgi:hypothetical protein